jgi:DnaJ family protein C protein 3
LDFCFLFPEKKAKFDNGEDPLDPEQQNGGGWQNGGFPGGFPFGQGFQFKFHFP